MSDETKKIETFEYFGHDFQQKVIWQLLVEPEFAKKTIPDISIEYFEDPYLKRLFIMMLEYYKEFDRVPNLQNKSIEEAIHKYKSPNNPVEGDILLGKIDQIKLWNERIINKNLLYDGDVVRANIVNFIKQQEYRKVAEQIINDVRSGKIRKSDFNARIENKFKKIATIGDEEDYGRDVVDNIDDVLSDDFRDTIPTGIEVIDQVTGNGLGKGEIGLVLAPSGIGKAQPLTSKILTPNGWIKMGDVKLNDSIIGSDGKSQKVLGVYPQGKRPIYKIKFNDGCEVYCDEEHLWSVNSQKQRDRKTSKRGKTIWNPDYEFKTRTTKEIFEHYVKTGKDRNFNYRVPIVKPIQFNKQNQKIDPYLLGVLIGDGSLTQSSPKFTNVDEEIINNISLIIDKNFTELSVKQVSKSITYSITGKRGVKNKLQEELNKLNLTITSDKKFIPKEYLYSSIDDRIKLLQGLMDSDGYCSKTGRVQYTTTSKKLANNIKELILSLGGFCTIKNKNPKYKYKNETKEGKLSYILTLSFSDENIKIFSLNRKQERVIYRDKYKNNKSISSITYSHEEEAQCIYVENNDHLYVTDDYILTHNTTLLTKVANSGYNDGKKVLQIIFEDTEKQIQRKHYAIWSKIAQSEIPNNKELVKEKVLEFTDKMSKLGAKLDIIRLSQEDTTINTIRAWIERQEKKFGYKYDMIVIDYLDCLEPNVKSVDLHAAELSIIKSFEALAGDYNIPCWSAIQTNRTGFNVDFVDAHNTGGNIKRIQKSHFVMSIAKPTKANNDNIANIKIIKARFARDGHEFKDCIFNNDTLEIRITDQIFNSGLKIKKIDEDDVDKINKKIESLNHGKLSEVIDTNGMKISDLNNVDNNFENNEISEETNGDNDKNVDDTISDNKNSDEDLDVEEWFKKIPLDEENEVSEYDVLLNEMRKEQGEILKE